MINYGDGIRSVPSGALADLQQSRPHPARMYDYYLGGKDHYEADREAAEKAIAVCPDLPAIAHSNRAFMHRATRHLAAEHGIRQFLDIGTGIPTQPNLHEVAQGVEPESRVVYVDNDPIVLVHAEALLQSTSEGVTAFVSGDITQPEDILASPVLRETLDLSKPVGLSTNAIFHFVPDDRRPYLIVRRLLDGLAPGSALCLSHITGDVAPNAIGQLADVYIRSGIPAQARTHAEVERFFAGLELVDPGVVMCHRWKPPPGRAAADAQVSLWAGVGLRH